jgi:hypothetical protein
MGLSLRSEKVLKVRHSTSDQISSVFFMLRTPFFAPGGERADQMIVDHAR